MVITKIMLVLMIGALVTTMSQIQFWGLNVAYAKKSPYDSGYDHGCKDAKISDASDRYINQPKRRPSFHTQQFMTGYNDGFGSCGNTGSRSSGSNNIVGNGDEIARDSQELKNVIDKACAASKTGSMHRF